MTQFQVSEMVDASMKTLIAGARTALVSVVFTVLIVLALIDEAIIRWSRFRDDGARQAAEAKVAHDDGEPMPRGVTPTPRLLARPPPPPGARTSEPERHSNDVAYYAARYGYQCQRHRAVTKDGFVLELFRISRPDVPSRKRAVVLQHGLFMSPGIFVTNETDSLAFLLADLGYDVWLGSNRCVVLEHEHLSSSDDRFWDWSVDELAQYDVPCIVDHVLASTGLTQLAWIGLSQGNAQGFMAFSSNPVLASKISLFVALAPVGRLGDLITKPLKSVQGWDHQTKQLIFGTGEFIPLISLPMKILPAAFFSHLAYPMFNYLFRWSDRNWKYSRRPKYFQFTPRPQSTKLVIHWSEMTLAGKLQRSGDANGVPGATYPLEQITCPIALFHGQSDYLADCAGLVRFFRDHKFEHLKHVEEIPDYEHMDLIWARDAPQKVFSKIAKLLEAYE